MKRLAVTLALCLAAAVHVGAQSSRRQPASRSPFDRGLKVEITVPASVRSTPLTGRVYFIVARSGDREPRLQIGRTGTPFFGRDVENLAPGQAAVIDASDLGTPVASLKDLPPGDYVVQAFVNLYSEFQRADGHTVWMHDDQWEGQHWNVSPGNLYSQPQTVRIDATTERIRLSTDQVIGPAAVPADTAFVKRLKLQSPLLTKFWGRPIFLGATVLLPRDYATSTVKYPVLYRQGHFSLGAPLGFEEGSDLHAAWMRDDFPRMIVVTLQHPTPYFDDSYGVNSANVGPYGDALMQELIPEVERQFRVIGEPWARITDGGSTGGWISLAHQIFYPDFYGGVWSYCPDSVTFTDVEGINVYTDENAYHRRIDWRTVPIINTREVNGHVRLTSEQRNHMELVNGTRGRSGEQLDIWSAVFGPVGKDGYFEPLFDKRTGVINREVADYWREHYDLLEYLKRNWATVGPKLVDKIHVYTGTADNFFLNNSTKELELWMKTTENPHYEGFFLYGDGKGHCWQGPETTAERLKQMAAHIARHKPEGMTTPWWRY
ncbi:MAG: alpha/beta hydrolase-fold protein [Vicinamibacterales bacterium]